LWVGFNMVVVDHEDEDEQRTRGLTRGCSEVRAGLSLVYVYPSLTPGLQFPMNVRICSMSESPLLARMHMIRHSSLLSHIGPSCYRFRNILLSLVYDPAYNSPALITFVLL